MVRNSQENYELILKVRARFEKFLKTEKTFVSLKKKIDRFLNKIKSHIDKEVYSILKDLQAIPLLRVDQYE